MKLTIADLADDQYAGRRVLVRVDFNVPIEGDQVREDYRLRRAVPTIEHLARLGARVLLISHLGKPRGRIVRSLSLKPVADRLGQILHVAGVRFSHDTIGEAAQQAVMAMKPGEVLVLENLRFYPGEEANDPAFARALASLGDLYVNDAFGTMHRAHASTYGAAQLFPIRLAGFLVQKEIKVLSQVRANPPRPFKVIVGGIKIADKLAALKALIPKADRVLLGGGIAYTFLAAQGMVVGSSPVERSYLGWATEVLARYGEKIRLPQDHIIARTLKDAPQLASGAILHGYRAFDIGPETSLAYTHELMQGEGCIFWNGPLGAFEVDRFAEGTITVARTIALAHWRGAMAVVGGGDTVASLRKAEVLETEMTHISTGGGAALQYVSGQDLPGLEVLSEKT